MAVIIIMRHLLDVMARVVKKSTWPAYATLATELGSKQAVQFSSSIRREGVARGKRSNKSGLGRRAVLALGLEILL